jgi:rhodanese-related sulfurtransferase
MAQEQVLQMQAVELKRRLDAGEDICLVDCRESWEHTLSAIANSTHLPLAEIADRVQELAFEEEIVVYCHHGMRSQHAAMILLESGFKKVHNLIGGIDAWSQVVDPSIPRY